jgi:hypothetical protein
VARFAKGLAVVIGGTLVWGTLAHAAEYKGDIKGEPHASLSLTVKKDGGDRYVTRIAFKKIPVQCDDGPKTSSGDASAGKPDEPGIKIKGGEFSGSWDYGKVSGKARGGGKLAGTISLKTDAGGSIGVCKSDDLDYVVHD